jgi:hypothetical protein
VAESTAKRLPCCGFRRTGAPAHASLLIRDVLTNSNTTVLPQPRYSADLAPAHFSLFPKLKSGISSDA